MPQTSPQTDSGQSEFSPHFQTAINNQRQQDNKPAQQTRPNNSENNNSDNKNIGPEKSSEQETSSDRVEAATSQAPPNRAKAPSSDELPAEQGQLVENTYNQAENNLFRTKENTISELFPSSTTTTTTTAITTENQGNSTTKSSIHIDGEKAKTIIPELAVNIEKAPSFKESPTTTVVENAGLTKVNHNWNSSAATLNTAVNSDSTSPEKIQTFLHSPKSGVELQQSLVSPNSKETTLEQNGKPVVKIQTDIQNSPQTVSIQSNTTTSVTAQQPLHTSTNYSDNLVSQLQQIVDEGSEIGTVIVNKKTSFSHQTDIGKILKTDIPQESGSNNNQVTRNVLSTQQTLTISTTLKEQDITQKPVRGQLRQDLSGVRQDTNQQFINAKLGSHNTPNNNQASQNSPDGGESFNQSGSGQLVSPTATYGEQSNTFSQIATTVQQEVASTSQPGETKPIILASGTTVYEQEILKQITDKFQIKSRLTETRLNLKLHPAELGELKIDLTVKEGSIRANVVAQSQHVQEILEKNISRLKTVLEGQGFSVDEITITAKSESASSFDLFDNQLFNRQQSTPHSAKRSHGTENVPFAVEDSLSENVTSSSGVNVTA